MKRLLSVFNEDEKIFEFVLGDTDTVWATDGVGSMEVYVRRAVEAPIGGAAVPEPAPKKSAAKKAAAGVTKVKK